MEKTAIVIHHNVKTNEYFFSTNHCQHLDDPNWVPATYYLPMKIEPREGFEDGLVKNFADMERYQNQSPYNNKEIVNPNPEYIVNERK